MTLAHKSLSVLVLVVGLFSGAPAWGAVAYDNDTQLLNQTLVATVASTFTHVNTGSNLALIVAIMMPGTDPGTWTVTYNSVAMTLIGNTTFQNNVPVDVARLYLFGLAAPASGSNTVSVTSSLGTLNTDLSAISFTGADQTGGTTTFNGYVSKQSEDLENPVSVTVTSGSTNDMVLAATISVANNHSGQGAGQTNRWEDNTGSINTAASTKAGAAGTVQMDETWDDVASTGTHDVVGVNITAAASGAGSGGITGFRPLLGVGQ